MSDTELLNKINALIAKADQMKKQDKMDLSSDQDLVFAIMNLVSIEEHLATSGGKTDNPAYYDLLRQVREMRKELLKKLVKNPQAEEWCISKHLLASAMRLMEVGTKQLGMDNKQEAYDFFQKFYQLYSLFWALNMGIMNSDDTKKVAEAVEKPGKKSKLLGAAGKLVRKIIDCCIE